MTMQLLGDTDGIIRDILKETGHVSVRRQAVCCRGELQGDTDVIIRDILKETGHVLVRREAVHCSTRAACRTF